MQTEINNCLSNSRISSDWLKILQEPIQLELPEHPRHYKCPWHKGQNCCGCEEVSVERQRVIFLRTLQPDYFNHYRPMKKPYYPQGFLEAHAVYQKTSDTGKAEAWKFIRGKFAGYFKALEDAESHNAGMKPFLTEMHEFFKQNNMPSQAETVRLRLLEFEEAV